MEYEVMHKNIALWTERKIFMEDFFERFIKAIRELDDAHDIAEALEIADGEERIDYNGDIEDIFNSMSEALENV